MATFCFEPSLNKASLGPQDWAGGKTPQPVLRVVCGGEVEEEEKWNGPCTVERGRMEEMKLVRNRLR